MSKLNFLYLKTAMDLGLRNVFSVALFRILTKSRLLKCLIPAGSSYGGKIFTMNDKVIRNERWRFDENKILDKATELVDRHQMMYFFRHPMSIMSPPNWFCNPFSGVCLEGPHRHFSEISDFNTNIGDIKTIWEASRFYWAPLLARAFCLSGNPAYLDTVNSWIEDWVRKNPYGIGPNWKCGQEASIRMLNVLLAAHILQQDANPSDTLTKFVAVHCERIRATFFYARAQDNNHVTSEAAGLFIGGSWLSQHADRNSSLAKQYKKWCNDGRRFLEEGVEKLVAADGSFSQKSLTYHRVLVDTLSLAEFWRRKCSQSPFSNSFYEKARKAVAWLYAMVDEKTGDGPNLGANDGARVMCLSSLSYREFRDSVQLGSVLFLRAAAYPEGLWDEPLFWLNLQEDATPEAVLVRQSKMFDDGGYVVLKNPGGSDGSTWGIIRYPRFKTRPSHADIFHFDLWYRGENILRDDGTYSYAAPEYQQSLFAGTGSHNTVQFDGSDQMPRLSRFLYGDWIKPLSVGKLEVFKGTQSWSGSYSNKGLFHERSVTLRENVWVIADTILGYKKSAVLRWRLKPAAWRIEGNCCLCDEAVLEITSSRPLKRFELVGGFESRHYLEMSPVPVLEAEVGPTEAVLKTSVRFPGGRQYQ